MKIMTTLKMMTSLLPHLIKVHHEKFVGGSQLSALACELPVKVGHVLSVALNKEWVSK